MAFYYNYTGPQPGTVNQNRVDRTPTAKAEEAASPWLAQAPKAAAQATTGANFTADGYYVYRPRYDAQPAPVKQTEPANPWLASPPAAAKASAPHAYTLNKVFVSHELTYRRTQPVQPAAAYHPHYPMYYAGHPQPEPTRIWYGSTKAEVDAQNAAIAQTVGATKPMELIPANATAGQQFYCRELDGAYTLRTMTDIETSCQPGSWHKASSGYPYFIRAKAA
ncbi:MAG: hypothetical protein Q9208_005167 [Pyrenodesmia sp. 3 TL-2023]